MFSIAIVLIVFIGGELFTGNNMTMAMGAYHRNLYMETGFKVCLVNYIGNFVGAFFKLFVVKSGASHQIFSRLLQQLLAAKLSAPPCMCFYAVSCVISACVLQSYGNAHEVGKQQAHCYVLL